MWAKSNLFKTYFKHLVIFIVFHFFLESEHQSSSFLPIEAPSTSSLNYSTTENPSHSDAPFFKDVVLKQDGGHLGLYTKVKLGAGKLIGPVTDNEPTGMVSSLF